MSNHPVIDFVSHNPIVGFFACAINITAAIIIKLTITRIDPVVMDWIQAGAWLSTIFMAFITTLSWGHRIYKKYFKKWK